MQRGRLRITDAGPSTFALTASRFPLWYVSHTDSAAFGATSVRTL